MRFGPTDKFYVVIIPRPGNPSLGPEDWEDMLAAVNGTDELQRIFAGTIAEYAMKEDYYVTDNFEEAVDIAVGYFPEHADKDWSSFR